MFEDKKLRGTYDPNIRLIVIDSFCGAGGVTEGFHRAVDDNGNNICKVIIGINHDLLALLSHAENHPDTVHFVEDFTELDPRVLLKIVDQARILYPNAKLLFWASAECTHHSKAKGGLPRDADSRSLPEHIERYVEILNPDIIGVENVVEFVDWGPLDEMGKPIKELKGIYYKEWVDSLLNYGYFYEYSVMNAADYGAYTSRIRYFGVFARQMHNIIFPIKTHSKKGKDGLYKWNPVKAVLELEKVGESIFNRPKPLVPRTVTRVTNGILKFHVPEKDKNGVKQMLTVYYGNGYNIPVDEPCGTVTTNDRFSLVTSQFMANSYSGGGQLSDLEEPNPTVTTVPKQSIVSLFMDQQYGESNPSSLDSPAGTITTNPKLNLTSAWLLNPQYDSKGSSIDSPCFTLIARMDKMPPYLVQTATGGVKLKINKEDHKEMRALKVLCNKLGIVDIYMRGLFISELKRIQGFRDSYVLKGTQKDKKKFIGNAVECTQAKVLAESIASSIF